MPKTVLTLRYHWKAVLLWRIGLGALLIGCLTVVRADAWVDDRPHVIQWASNEVTLVAHRFCEERLCVAEFDEAWRTVIRQAAQEWDDVGANFRFHVREARGDEEICQPRQGEVHVIVVSSGSQLCEGVPAASSTKPNWWWGYILFGRSVPGSDPPATLTALIYINAHYRFRHPLSQYGILLHEIGHIPGLGHPDEAGQQVAAIMNGQVRAHDSLQPDDEAGLLALHGERRAPIPTAVFLENPQHASSQSGIGVISGWVCEAESLTLTITDGEGQYPLVVTDVPYGGDRADTESQCGDRDNGFGLLFNWNTLGDGVYGVRVETEDGRVGWNPVAVATLGQEYRRGLQGQWELDGFPDPHSSVTVEWSEALQNFVIVEHDPNGGTP